jgi:hypothetical protein
MQQQKKKTNKKNPKKKQKAEAHTQDDSAPRQQSTILFVGPIEGKLPLRVATEQVARLFLFRCAVCIGRHIREVSASALTTK